MSTFNGVGTALRGYTMRRPDGTHHATLWFVLVDMPVIPLRRYRILAEGSSTERGTYRQVTRHSYKIFTRGRPHLGEALLTYLIWWVIGPVVVLGPFVGACALTGVISSFALNLVLVVVAFLWMFAGGVLLDLLGRRLRHLP